MTPKADRLNAAHLRTLRDLFMLARRNGMSVGKASALVSKKAHELGLENARKYVQVIVQQLEGDDE